MFQYTVKRLLLMIPTFFFVSLVIFLVLNLAPGRPGQQAQQGVQQTSEAGNKNESYRIFKQQFNLDKPILLNARFALSPEEVEEMVALVVQGTYKELPEDQRPAIKDVVEAQNDLEDLGQYAVPHLVQVATAHPDPDMRHYAVQRLTVNARRPLQGEFSRDQLADEDRQRNREIDLENTLIARWSYPRDADAATQQEIQDKWGGWLKERQDRFDYSAGESLAIFFLDTRFARYWGNLLRLDLGVSNLDRQPITQKIVSKLKYSVTLGFGTVLLVYLLAVPLGVFSAVKQGTRQDQALTVSLFMLYSLPTFFVGSLLLTLLSIGPEFHLWPAAATAQELQILGGAAIPASGLTAARAFVVAAGLAYAAWSAWKITRRPENRAPGALLGHAVLFLIVVVLASVVAQVALYGRVSVFPTGDFESPNTRDMTTLQHLADVLYHLVLPIFCLTYGGLAALSRYARSGLLDIIRADYIRTARAKGLSEPVVIIKHAVRNGMIPVLTLLGTLLPAIIGGSVVIEVIFNIPGMGLYLFESITLRDYNAVMGVFLCQSALTLLGLLLSDISYALVDPRISFK
jgi:ABC-type dipeptide/oligopeptide/nickel transport system permease component